MLRLSWADGRSSLRRARQAGVNRIEVCSLSGVVTGLWRYDESFLWSNATIALFGVRLHAHTRRFMVPPSFVSLTILRATGNEMI